MKKQTSQRLSTVMLFQILLITVTLNIRAVQCFSMPMYTSPLLSTTSTKSSLQDRNNIRSDGSYWILRSRIRHHPTVFFTQLYSTNPSNNGAAPAGQDTEENNANGTGSSIIEERDLYEMLNASPTDSAQTLKQNYRALARQTHPDALIGVDSEDEREQAAIQFAEITAAYKTLSDPKSRLQYDRSLKAKEFTDNVVDSLEGGFRVAFKTAYQTADSIRSVGAQIDKAREETTYRLELASKIAQYNTQSKTLKQRALGEENRRKEFQQRLDHREDRKSRHPWLEQNNDKSSSSSSYKSSNRGSSSSSQSEQEQQNQELTATMADEIVKNLQQNYQTSNSNNNNGNNNSNFGDPATNGSKEEGMAETLTKTIDRLAQVETEFKEMTQIHVQSQKEMAKARTQLDRIQEQEEKALKVLEEAQAAYEAAKQATVQQERAYGEVLRQERVSNSNVEKVQSTLARQKDRTKETLRRTEDLYIWKENSWLREEARKAKSLSEKLQDKADELQNKADELKRELDSI
mmetsp:Transcript_37374/g.90755  ORF Transcript_37374/g.90755 Transcript_37374/m.90755 type:complete len:519 (-) Transcript_37374:35-1591(-)